MDPTHFLSHLASQRNDAGRPSPNEIDAFYASHGLELLVALSRWRAALSAWRPRLRIGHTEAADIAPIAHRS